MIESPRGEQQRRNHRTIAAGALLVLQQRFLGVFHAQSHLLELVRIGPRLINEYSHKRVAPKQLVARRVNAELRVDAAQRADRFHKLIAVVAKEGPIEVVVKLVEIHRIVLP